MKMKSWNLKEKKLNIIFQVFRLQEKLHIFSTGSVFLLLVAWRSLFYPLFHRLWYSTKCISELALTLVKVVRWLFFGHFFTLLMWATIFGIDWSLPKIGLSIKSNNPSQVKTIQISDTHGISKHGVVAYKEHRKTERLKWEKMNSDREDKKG